MPVDSRHAFASGSVFGHPSRLARLRRTGAARAWASFERGALIGDHFRIGPSAWCANTGPRERVRLGHDVVCRGILRRETFGDGLLEIGDDAYIGDDCIISCSEQVVIGAGTLLGHGVQIFDNNSHPLGAGERGADWAAIRHTGDRGTILSAPVHIGAQTWVGFGSFVLKGVTIGEGAIIGAGSIVTRDVPAGTVVAGNPAQPL
jgi:acetyltransferase-like isoleucine patch superfamily enzyme